VSRVDVPAESLSPEKRALFSLLLSRERLNTSPVERVPRRTETGPVALSFAQERLWLAEQAAPGSAAYNVAAVLRLRGALRVEALEAAFTAVLRRHEVLRTRFATLNGEPAQIIEPPAAFQLAKVDLRPLDERERDAAIRRLSREEARRPFELGQPALVRARLLQCDDVNHVLLLTMHHIVSDGWSVGVLTRELSALYDEGVSGRSAALPELTVQYADYALWQRRRAARGAFDAGIEYWKHRLSGAPGVLDLPGDRPRLATHSLAGALHRIAFPSDLAERLKAFSQREGITLFMTLVAAFMVLLHRWSGQDDILVGSPVADRSRPELEPLIGFFTNTVVLRGELAGDPTFRELLARVREDCVGAFEHQEIPFSQVVEALQPERLPGRPPLVQVLFVFQSVPRRAPGIEGLSVRIEDGETGASPFDLALSLQEEDGCLTGSFEYTTELFDRQTIAAMTRHLDTLLEDAARHPDRRVSQLRMVSDDERKEVSSWGRGQRSRPDVTTVPELVARQSHRTPDAMAVRWHSPGEPGATTSLAYSELRRRMSRLAATLRDSGVGPEVRVGVCVGPSGWWPVAVLGVLEAGGACVLLDPATPPARLQRLAALAGTELVIVDADSEATFAGRRTLDLEQAIAREQAHPMRASDGSSVVDPSQLAFVVFTSGSTGDPKCVGVPHAAIVNHCLSVTSRFELTGADRVLQFSSLGFDVALEEVLPALTCGATVLIRPWSGPPSIQVFLRFLERERATVVNLPSSYWHAWADEVATGAASVPAHVRLVISGSERTWAGKFREWQHGLNRRGRWLNAYGTTEATITSTLFDPVAAGMNPHAVVMPVGRPIDNTDVFVLDEHLQPVPPRIAGELYVGGNGVARGYLDDPVATAERFVPHPFGDRPGERLYRTGDRARWRGGQLEVLGRADRQVKIRGFRIEPGEVEAVLTTHPAVDRCAVVVQGHHDNLRLIAHVVTDGSPGEAERLREFLAVRLPAFMVPDGFVFCAALPTTPAGKVDYRALSSVGVATSRPAYVAPHSLAERTIAGIWMNLLDVHRIGVHDNFFALGGHSLLAIQALSRIRASLSIDLTLRQLFETPTVGELARCVENLMPRESRQPVRSRIRKQDRVPDRPLSMAQEQLWEVICALPPLPLFNMPFSMRLVGALDVRAFEWALNEVVRRHEVLRTALTNVNGLAIAAAEVECPLRVHQADMRGLPSDSLAADVARVIASEAHRPFDLAKPPLLRASVLRLAEHEHILLVTLPHIIADLWSIDVLRREVEILYSAKSAGAIAALPDLPIQYADYARWQRGWLETDEGLRQRRYWTDLLAPPVPPGQIPADRPRRETLSFEFGSVTVKLDPGLTTSIRRASGQASCTVFMLVITALKLVIHEWTGETDLHVATLVANRTVEETEGLIGLFANTLVLRTSLAGGPSSGEALARVRDTTLAAYANQEVPFDLVVRDLIAAKGARPGRELLQILVLWQEDDGGPLRLPGISVRALGGPNPIADIGVALTVFELILSVSATPDGVGIHVRYDSGLFDESIVRTLCERLEAMLDRMTSELTGGGAASPGNG
jgi:amino acid adenylation domain-containing protein